MKTATEFIKSKFPNHDGIFVLKNIEEFMIEFAKMHVQETLKKALESIPCLGSSTDIASYEEVEEAVLSSYPLENII